MDLKAWMVAMNDNAEESQSESESEEEADGEGDGNGAGAGAGAGGDGESDDGDDDDGSMLATHLRKRSLASDRSYDGHAERSKCARPVAHHRQNRPPRVQPKNPYL